MPQQRPRGFNLVEISFVIIVMLILAAIIIAGAGYMINQSKGQNLVSKARAMMIAAENYTNRLDKGYPQTASTTTLDGWLSPYIKDGPSAATGKTSYDNPYASGTFWLTPYASGADGATTRAQGVASYPDVTLSGRIYYIFKGNPSWNSIVADTGGGQTQTFDQYFVQAFDDQGVPLVTVGR